MISSSASRRRFSTSTWALRTISRASDSASRRRRRSSSLMSRNVMADAKTADEHDIEAVSQSTTIVLWQIGGTECAGRRRRRSSAHTSRERLGDPGDEATQKPREQPTPRREAGPSRRVAQTPRAAHDRTTHVPEGLDQAASSSNRRLGSMPGRHSPRRGPQSARTGTRQYSPRATADAARQEHRQPPDDDHQAGRSSFRSRASDGSCCLIHR